MDAIEGQTLSNIFKLYTLYIRAIQVLYNAKYYNYTNKLCKVYLDLRLSRLEIYSDPSSLIFI